MKKEAINFAALGNFLGKAKKGLTTGWGSYGKNLGSSAKSMVTGRVKHIHPKVLKTFGGGRSIGAEAFRDTIRMNPYKTTAIGAGAMGTAGAIGHDIRSNRKRQ